MFSLFDPEESSVMRIRRVRAAAVLVVALGVGALTGAAPAVAAPAAAAEARPLLPPDWYRVGHFATLAECRVAWQDAAQNGQYTGIGACYWYNGDRNWPAAYYFNVYIP
jgi:hypothetical protein